MTNELYTDKTPIQPVEPEYSLSRINNKVRKYAGDVRRKIFGKDVREAIARSIEVSGEESGQAILLANDANSSQKKIEKKFDEVLQNITVDSEVILSRDGYVNLPKRLEGMNLRADESYLSAFNKRKTAQIVFTCDDGAYQDYVKLLPIVKEKQVKFSLAIISDWVGKNEMNTQFMTWEQIREFTQLGCELMSHSTEQQHLKDLSDTQLEKVLKDSKNIIRSNGFLCDFIAYPYGENDFRVRNVSKKYYRGGLGIKGDNKIYGSNDDFWAYNSGRVALGSSFDPVQIGFPEDTSSLEYYKARVDDAIKKRAMLIFMVHTATNLFNASQQQYLKDLIDYIRSKGIEPTTISEAINNSGNVLEVGDIETGYLKVDSEGEIRSTNNQFMNNLKLTKLDEYGFDLNSLQLPVGLIVTPISTKKAQSDVLSPSQYGGTLFTNNIRNISFDFVFQIYIDVLGNRFERRIVDFERLKWSPWKIPLKKYNIEINSDQVTVKAMTQYQIAHKHALFNSKTIISVNPDSNLPFGFMYDFSIIQGELVIRVININSTDQIFPKNKWNVNFIN